MAVKRKPVNIKTFLITNVIVFVCVTVTDCSVPEILRDTMNDFDISLSDLPNYTDYVDHHSYISGSVSFNPKAMAGYYRFTENFMNSIMDQNVLKEDMFTWRKDTNGNYFPQLSETVSANQLLKEYWILIFVLAVLVFITLLIPISGIIFCCCRCCAKSCGRAKPSDKKKDTYSKMFQGGLTLCLFTLLLACVICAFATNQQMEEGADEFPDNIRKSYKDSVAYLDSTVEQAVNLLDTNFKQFHEPFENIINDAGGKIMDMVTVWNNMSAINDVLVFVDAISDIKNNLLTLDENIKELGKNVDSAKAELTTIKTSVAVTLASCALDQCTEVKEQISSFALDLNTEMIPDVEPLFQELNKFDETKLREAAKSGVTNLDNIEQKINESVTGIVEQVEINVSNADTVIEENLSNIRGIVDNITQQINEVNNTLEDGYYYITNYSPYFYYGGLTISCILLLILALIGFGLIWGVCGKRPEKHRTDSFTKKTGSLFLDSATFIIFASNLLIGVLTMVMLIVGFAADRSICYSLRNPNESTIMKILDEFIVKNNEIGWEVRPSDILVECGNNESIYKAFNLSSKFNIEKLVKELDVNATLDEIMINVNSALDQIVDSNLPILTEENLQTLETLTTIKSDIDMDTFENQLNRSITNNNIQNVLESLQNICKLDVLSNTTCDQLKKNIQQLEDFDQNYLRPMSTQAQQALDLARTVDNELKLNGSSFQDSITSLIKAIQDAEKTLEGNPKLIVEAASSFGNVVKEQIESYLGRVIHVTQELGQCGHLSDALNSILITICDKIVLPWNGFWVSLFISLLVFVPSVIILPILASLYRRYRINIEYTGGQRFQLDKQRKKSKTHNERFPEWDQMERESICDDMAPKQTSKRDKQQGKSKKQNGQLPKWGQDHEPRYDDMAPKLTPYSQMESTRF